MPHPNTNVCTTKIVATTTTALDSSSITKTTTSNGTMTHHGQNMDSPWKADTCEKGSSEHSFSRADTAYFKQESRVWSRCWANCCTNDSIVFFVLEPPARLLLNFKRSHHNSKQSLKQLHLYLHVNHTQSYSDEAPDTYFFGRRDVGRGAGRSTVIAGFSNRRPCERFGRRNVHLQRSLEP